MDLPFLAGEGEGVCPHHHPLGAEEAGVGAVFPLPLAVVAEEAAEVVLPCPQAGVEAAEEGVGAEAPLLPLEPQA